jgi:hypothetical protein
MAIKVGICWKLATALKAGIYWKLLTAMRGYLLEVELGPELTIKVDPSDVRPFASWLGQLV